MTRRSFANLATAASAAMLIFGLFVWHYEVQAHLPTNERYEQRIDEFLRATENLPRGSAEFAKLSDELLEYQRVAGPPVFVKRQQFASREPLGRIAEQIHHMYDESASEQHRFTRYAAHLPLLVLLILAVLPAGWMVDHALRWERFRWPRKTRSFSRSGWSRFRCFQSHRFGFGNCYAFDDACSTDDASDAATTCERSPAKTARNAEHGSRSPLLPFCWALQPPLWIEINDAAILPHIERCAGGFRKLTGSLGGLPKRIPRREDVWIGRIELRLTHGFSPLTTH